MRNKHSVLGGVMLCFSLVTPLLAEEKAAQRGTHFKSDEDHSQMDHSQMDHSQMDHSQMDHSQMDHSQMDHSQMDHSQMDHSQMDHSQMDHSQMDHSQMGHGDHSGHGDHAMTFDEEGMVMNFNTEKLPGGCEEISEDISFTVRAGVDYADKYNGDIFGMDTHEIRVQPCSRVTITFINEDAIRHQFMIHGLPKYIYQQGMFHIEATGGATKQGTFIAPSEDKTYLLHCDLAQHMEKGMKGQLVVGSGSGDLTSVPGVSAKFRPDEYISLSQRWSAIVGGFLFSLLVVLPVARRAL